MNKFSILFSLFLFFNCILQFESTLLIFSKPNNCSSSKNNIKEIWIPQMDDKPVENCYAMISESANGVGPFITRVEIKDNKNICQTGIEYLGDSREGSGKPDVCCSFKIHLDIIERLEKNNDSIKYLGKYWKIVFSKKFTDHNNHLFYMNTPDWWKQNNYTTLKIIPGTWTNYVDTEYS